MRSLHFVIPLALAFGATCLSQSAYAQYDAEIAAEQPPPELPVYEQPPLPEPGYIWTPGYWSYGEEGYFWVPGTWVEPPQPGLLWTPGYWGWRGGRYFFNAGYWGPEVGFYGGIDYGFGYTGYGYQGGYWRSGVFSYNREVNNFGRVHVTNVYVRQVNRVSVNRVSFNGGQGGIARQPRPEEQAASRVPHVQPTQAQIGLAQTARGDRSFLASTNHGRPPVTAVARPDAVAHGSAYAPHPAAQAPRPPEPGMAPRPPEPSLAPRPPAAMAPPRPVAPSPYRSGPAPQGFARPMPGGMAPRPMPGAPPPGAHPPAPHPQAAPHPGERQEPPKG